MYSKRELVVINNTIGLLYGYMEYKYFAQYTRSTLEIWNVQSFKEDWLII